MTPHRSNDRGTLRIDLRTHIGRIARASGTNHEPTRKKIVAMIREFNTQEPLRLDLLRAIDRGTLAPIIVYEAYRTRRLDELPTSETLRPLATALWDWYAEVECGESQKAAHKTATNYLLKGAKNAKVADTPDRLRAVRDLLKSQGYGAQFNRVRASTWSFIRDTLGAKHQLHAAISDIQPLPEVKKRKGNPQTYLQLVELAGKLEPRHGRTLWAMSLTGMGAKERWHDGWEVKADRVEIAGEKRSRRVRIVPVVRPHLFSGVEVEQGMTWKALYRQFLNALAEASSGTVQPYDLRRSYANLLERAGVIRTRRRLYMGHSGTDPLSGYEWHEVAAFLGGDAALIEAAIQKEERSQLAIVRGGRA